MSRQKIYIGKTGEALAERFLKANGYRILAANYRTRFGEIDLIANDKDTLCFIEVKTRNSSKFGAPAEAVSAFKQRQISKAALIYLKTNNLLGKKARFDVVCVLYSQAPSPELSLIKNAFELEASYVI